MTIFAKSKPKQTLKKHTFEVLNVLEHLSQMPQYRFDPQFWIKLSLAGLIHDFGKATAQFQSLISDGSIPDYRHEILSAYFAKLLPLQLRDKDDVALWVLGHHRSLSNKRIQGVFQDRDSIFRLFGVENEVENLTKESILTAGRELQEYSGDLMTLLNEGIAFINSHFFADLPAIEGQIEFDFGFVQSVYSLQKAEPVLDPCHYYGRGLLMSADHLASAGETSICDLPSPDFGSSFCPYPHQKQLQETQENVILIAPTGSGKTEGSLLWMHRNNSGGWDRLFYILPFTASVNKMYHRFQNYFNKDCMDRVGLEHGMSHYYLFKIFSEDISSVSRHRSLNKKIFRSAKVSTPYQIIRTLFRPKGYEVSLSELKDAILIVDEIHAYDKRSTSLILHSLKFLKDNFNTRVCIMSATLPTSLLGLFQDILEIPQVISLPDEQLEKFNRHRVHILDGGIHDYLEQIEDDLQKEKKVLVICNTVKQSQKVFSHLSGFNLPGIRKMLLHSRFILRDREDKENQLMQWEQVPHKGILLVSTQVVEVSLDLDYDVIYSEPAPIDALLQRFGRVNRKRKKGIANCHVFRKGGIHDHMIYDSRLVERTFTALERYFGKDNYLIRESRLQYAVDFVYKSYSWTEDSIDKLFPKYLQSLRPFNEADDLKDFYEFFQSYPVLPKCLIGEFEELMESERYFDAMGLITQVSYLNWKDSQEMIPARKGLRTFGDNLYIVDKPYDSMLGLQPVK